MQKQILLALALASCWTSLLVGQSQPPPPTPTEHGEKKQDVSGIKDAQSQPANNPSPTTSATLHQSTPIPTRSSADEKSTVSDESSPINWALILGVANTVLLLCFNGILAGVAVYQYRLTQEQTRITEKNLLATKDAADASKKSADVAERAIQLAERNTAITERAVLLLESVDTRPETGAEEWPLEDRTLIAFTLKNYGGTVADAVKLTGEVTSENISLKIHEKPEITIPPNGSATWITYSLKAAINRNQLFAIGVDGTLRLYYRVDVTYKDVFTDKPHCYTAEGQYIPLLKAFITACSKSD